MRTEHYEMRDDPTDDPREHPMNELSDKLIELVKNESPGCNMVVLLSSPDGGSVVAGNIPPPIMAMMLMEATKHAIKVAIGDGPEPIKTTEH